MKNERESIKTIVEMRSFSDLVRLATYLFPLTGKKGYFLALPPHSDATRERQIFFSISHDFSGKVILVHYSFTLKKDGDFKKCNYIVYNERKEKINFTQKRGLESSKLHYFPLFEVERLNENYSPIKNSEKVSLHQKIQHPVVKYQKGKNITNLIRIACNFERVVLVLEKKQSFLYVTGFFSPIFPLGIKKSSRSPLLYVKESKSREREGDLKRNFARYSKTKRDVTFLMENTNEGRTVPLIHLKKFPFNVP